MATLAITKAWADGTILLESDLDNIKNDVETFVNITKLNDDNLQTAGITGSSKLIDDSISSAKLPSNVILAEHVDESALVHFGILNYSITAEEDQPTLNNMRISLKTANAATPSATDPVKIMFRNATSATGTPVMRTVSAATTVQLDSGATLGLGPDTDVAGKNNENIFIYVYAIDNAGTVELAISPLIFDDGTIVSTTVLDASADSNQNIYSDVARSNVAIKLIGRIETSEASIGSWTTAVSEISLLPFETKVIACRYSRPSAQTIPNSTITIVDYDTKLFDTHNAVTTGASWKFTAPRAGIYYVSANILYIDSSAWDAGEQSFLELRKNGAVEFVCTFKEVEATGTLQLSYQGSIIINLAAGDTVDARVRQLTGANLNTFASGAGNTIAIHRVGRAV